MEQNFVLLFGMSRSGTTWIGKIFDSHPYTVYRHEPDSFVKLNIPLTVPVSRTEEYMGNINNFVHSLLPMCSIQVCAKLPIFQKDYYSWLRFQAFKINILMAKIVGGRIVKDFPIINPINSSKENRLWIVWKSIESAGRLGVIARSIKRCRAILIVRNPCGYIASIIRGEAQNKFKSDDSLNQDYGIFSELVETEQAKKRNLTLKDIKTMEPVERLAWLWVLFNEKAMDDIEDLENCMVVRYEDVCRDPHNLSRELLQFAGLSWNQQTEDFIKKSISNEKNSYYSIFKDPIHAAEKWKDQLSALDIKKIIKIVQDSRPGRLYYPCNTYINSDNFKD